MKHRLFNTITRKATEMGRLFRSPLSLRIVSGLFVSLVIIEGIVLIPSLERRRQEILDQIEEVSEGKVDWILMTYPGASGQELLGHLNELRADPMLQIIQGGAVYRPDGSLEGNFGEAPALSFTDARQQGQLYQTTSQGSRYDVAWTALQADGNEYVIVLRHDAAGTRAALNGYILRFIGIVLLISAFITLVMMVLLSRQLITPVLTLRRDLAKAGHAIATDQPTPQFDSCQFYRQDELGEMIATFRQMYEQISQAVCDRKQAEAQLLQSNLEMQQYIKQVDRVTAAVTAVGNGTFQPSSLDAVAARDDELGDLARMFQMMAAYIQQREDQLKQQLKELTIEIDQAKRQQQVAQITKSEYFKELQSELDNYQLDEFWG